MTYANIGGVRSDAGPPEAATPAWLAQLVTALAGGLEPGAARALTARIDADVARLGGLVPFAVVHDWHAATVVPLLRAVCADQAQVGELHARALAGSPVAAARWRDALEPALREIYYLAYPYDDAYQANYESAQVYGTAHDFGEAGTREYATYYAELATGANRRAHADANAIACARACAAAFAAADPAGYARTYPAAAARAYARALASSGGARALASPGGARALASSGYARALASSGDAAGDQAARVRAASARLAAGLAASLGRAGREAPHVAPGD